MTGVGPTRPEGAAQAIGGPLAPADLPAEQDTGAAQQGAGRGESLKPRPRSPPGSLGVKTRTAMRTQ
jgi:hypothetical protein